jgi:nucleoside-diphosphate-sugar epimerase
MMKVLFIGGTGVISSACSDLAIARGMDLYHLNRGQSASIRTTAGAKTLIANIRDSEATSQALGDHDFDVVVDWIAFEPDHIRTNLELFKNRTGQYLFISSASAYQTPPEILPITEETILDNPFWGYSQKKIACERVLEEAGSTSGFPYTIVRPSHTYDKTLVPMVGGVTALHRMKQGLPVVVHGDGTSLWTLTHNTDFAPGLVGLFGKEAAIHQAYHITSDEWLSWNHIYQTIARAAGVEPHLVHIPSDVIARHHPEIGAGLLGDKSHSMIFDNSKIKALVPEFVAKVPFAEGVAEIVEWYQPERLAAKYDPDINIFMENIIEMYARV